MEYDVCNVIYLDKRAAEDKVWVREFSPIEQRSSSSENVDSTTNPQLSLPVSSQEVEHNIQSILTVFEKVSVHRDSKSCLAEIKNTYEKNSERNCTILLIDIPSDDEIVPPVSPRIPRSPSPTSGEPPEFQFFPQPDPYGMQFLLHVSSEMRSRLISPLVLPVALLSGSHEQKFSRRRESLNPFQSPDRMRAERFAGLEPVSKMRYFDAGAADVLTSPTSADRIRSLPAHAHWMKIETEKRISAHLSPHGHRKKTSWVGTKDDKPYTQLKEAMVSELMEHICDPELEDPPIDASSLRVDPGLHDIILNSVGSWSFSAHRFTDDELLYGAYLMLDHALKLEALEKWRMSKDQLLSFLIATRRVYNASVLYHNFRHACDVLQAIFIFLVRVGALPPISDGGPAQVSPLAGLIDPFYTLILLISAIGHDVGHPGVNNGFLVTVNAPLAQLYNDRSVLESFHCAAYSQILRRYWKSAFNDRNMRRLMIDVILATDMGVHRQYMSQMENLQETLEQNPNVESWSDKMKEETKDLLCCLLIKCADICNVAREFEVASEWARILIDEFYAQGQIEQDLNIPSALFGGPPDPNSLLQKCQSQIGFMNFFANPLFGGMTKLLPAMKFTTDAIEYNKTLWQEKSKVETERLNNEQQRFDNEMINTNKEGRLTDNHDRESPRASNDLENLEKKSPPTLALTSPREPFSPSAAARRASGGIAAHFAGLSEQTQGGGVTHKSPDRSSATSDPPTRSPSAPNEIRRRSSLLKFFLCCSPEASSPDSSPSAAKSTKDTDTPIQSKRDPTKVDSDTMKYEEINENSNTHTYTHHSETI